MHGELFRDITDASAELQKEQTRDLELLSIPQAKQNTTTTIAGGGGSKVSAQVSHGQDGQHHAATVIINAERGGATVHYEDSTINVLHV